MKSLVSICRNTLVHFYLSIFQEQIVLSRFSQAMKIPGDFEFEEYIGQKWLNSEGKESWIQEVNAQTTERCIRQCLRTRSGTEICVGYTFNIQDKRCYLKSVNDAIELEDSDEFTSGRIVIGNTTNGYQKPLKPIFLFFLSSYRVGRVQ